LTTFPAINKNYVGLDDANAVRRARSLQNKYSTSNTIEDTRVQVNIHEYSRMMHSNIFRTWFVSSPEVKKREQIAKQLIF
jgi:hypothetical protein